MKKKMWIFLTGVLFAVVLTGCGDENQEEQGSAESVSSYISVEAEEDGNITFPTDMITEEATYINYDSEGTNIQLIAVRASDDTVRVTFNTCQSCNPSPQAYFVQEGDVFTCQNCGNQFHTDELGQKKGGCNPANIEELTIDNHMAVIPAGYLDQYAGNFSAWQGNTGE